MSLAAVSLDDKYTVERGRIYLTGIQALVRLPMMQRQRDLADGLNTAGFVSGYRGSPLGGLDQSLWAARSFLKDNHIHFEPGLNEDLAATAIWGSQQANLFPDTRYDGVFGMWYGKGPGVDRTIDVLKHANGAGTSKHGGVLFVAGDDHGAVSSTLAHQSDHLFMATMMPVLHPASVQDYLDYGLYGWAMSRYSGLWVGFKAISETVESSASVEADPDRVKIVMPDDFQMPDEGVSIRWPDDRFAPEQRLHDTKIFAALAFARANQLDKIVIDSPNPRLGIITTGKAYLDVRQALDDLGIDDAMAAEIGLRVYKVAMPWPLERYGARRFAEGLEEVLVVEEKRAIVENQLKEQLYNWRESVRPRVIGKRDEDSNTLLSPIGELTPARVARVIAGRIGRFITSTHIEERLAFLDAKERALAAEPDKIVRTPYFCSGCPHNSSTKVPEGSRATAGIGCHYMSIWMDRSTSTSTQMGGEGVPWIGQAPFTDEKHVFANLGDGTYHHSGLLAIRAAVSAGVNITYKILYNDAVAMTGGQPIETSLTVPAISRQVQGEGVARVVVVSDEPEKYPRNTPFAPGVTIRHRDELDAVQRELRDTPGVTVLIYDQTCAAEKRRRRKRGTYPDPAIRAVINDLVCEGCGDCSDQSNCISVEPLDTEFGRKRAINQSACNKDFSCLNGFCPSFVTVHGGELRKRRPGAAGGRYQALMEKLPAPPPADLTNPQSILLTGIGGTGVVTVGAILGMAAHLEGKGVTLLDQTGLAQKGGAVTSHIRIARGADQIYAVRIPAGGADVLIGCDLVVSAGSETLAKVQNGVTRAVVNQHKTPTAGFVLDGDQRFDAETLKASVRQAAGDNLTEFVDASTLATALMGDAIATNLFMLGYAYQRGLIPVSEAALVQAIQLNGVAVESNLRTFGWGRLAAADPMAVDEAARPQLPVFHDRIVSAGLGEVIDRRADHLTEYQDAAYARRYRDLVERVRGAEAVAVPGSDRLADAVARNFFKLLAYKDEYEIARLHADPLFQEKLTAQFEGDYKIAFHLAPPLIARRDPHTGHLRKRRYGAWMLPIFRTLAKFKGLRGTALDPFGHTAERRRERQLIVEYEAVVDELLASLSPGNHALAVEIAGLPARIRGFGHVKEQAIAAAKAEEAALMARFRAPPDLPAAADAAAE